MSRTLHDDPDAQGAGHTRAAHSIFPVQRGLRLPVPCSARLSPGGGSHLQQEHVLRCCMLSALQAHICFHALHRER
jgi:hypothetical protein